MITALQPQTNQKLDQRLSLKENITLLFQGGISPVVSHSPSRTNSSDDSSLYFLMGGGENGGFIVTTDKRKRSAIVSVVVGKGK